MSVHETPYSGRVLILVFLALTGLVLLAPRATPRSSAVIPSDAVGAVETDQRTTGAPQADRTGDGRKPDPSANGAPPPAVIDLAGATGRNPAYTAPPDFTGQATWWDSFGPGLYAAIRPDLGTKGDLAVVCGGTPWRCISVPIITTCLCKGPGSDRLIDLSKDAFSIFANPSLGVIHVVLSVVR